MPITVPSYDEQVGYGPPPGGRLTVDANPGAFGGQIAGAIGAVGGAVNQAANVADSIQELHDQTAATQIASDTSGGLTRVLHGDGQTTLGYTSLKGEDALNGRKDALSQITALKSAAMNQAQNARQ